MNIGRHPKLTFLTFTRLNLTRSTLHAPSLHGPKFTRPPNLHDSYLHAQIYTTPNLHKIYTTPHLHKSNLHAPKSTQNKLANLIWFGHQNIARVQNCPDITIKNSLCLFVFLGKPSKKEKKKGNLRSGWLNGLTPHPPVSQQRKIRTLDLQGVF